MSIGNCTQAVKLDEASLTLVLGNNIDLGGGGARNGTGKTTIINALSYALYGTALTNIRKDNLINRTNGKNMMVTVDFEINGNEYRIERGRKPNIFRFLVNDKELEEGITDEVQGDGRNTQRDIEKLLGMSHMMFKHILALNTYTEPFLSMRSNDQRVVIEQLLGITMLSEKAEVLKTQMKDTKDSIKEEEFHIKGIEDANQAIGKSITDLERRQKLRLKQHEETIESFAIAIDELEHLDIDVEIEQHALLATRNEASALNSQLAKDIKIHLNTIDSETKRLIRYEIELKQLENHECFSCGQKIHDKDHESMVTSKTEAIDKCKSDLKVATAKLDVAVASQHKIIIVDPVPEPFYGLLADAYDHKNKVLQLKHQHEVKVQESDPYVDQIEVLKSGGIQEINWDKMNSLTHLREHQEFLYKLLTNKDSFIRKRIIEQNLTYLNNRLDYYLVKLGLPHEVVFQPDLTVEITEMGRELDFDNLSRGERNRLILGLSWAFRDVFENMNTPINFMAVDELIDSGMDSNGVESSLSVLKEMVRERNKSVFLISHRDELVGRVNNTLQVIKENGFTTFSNDTDYTN